MWWKFSPSAARSSPSEHLSTHRCVVTQPKFVSVSLCMMPFSFLGGTWPNQAVAPWKWSVRLPSQHKASQGAQRILVQAVCSLAIRILIIGMLQPFLDRGSRSIPKASGNLSFPSPCLPRWLDVSRNKYKGFSNCSGQERTRTDSYMLIRIQRALLCRKSKQGLEYT